MTQGILTLALFALAYFLPSILAFSRRHPDRRTLLLLNLLLGVTVVGWFLILGAVMVRQNAKRQEA